MVFMKKITVDGNEACAKASYYFTELAGIYPITPSSPMAELIDKWSSENKLNIFNDKVKVVEMQSEGGAAGFIHGAASSGVLTTTYTASQGLLLMIPNMYKLAGEMLPTVFHVAARSLSTHALSIFGDHQDIYATRQTGVPIIASSSVQDAYYLSLITHLSALKGSMPFLHFFDGFRTSHEINKIDVLEDIDINNLVDWEAINKLRTKALNPNKPFIKGTAQNDDIYFQVTEARNSNYNNIPDIVNSYMEKINTLTGTNYKPFNYYGDINAKYIIVAMGSVCNTIKEVILKEPKTGLIEVHLYRPISLEYLLKVLPKKVTRIAVLDRTKEAGSNGEPLYLDMVNLLKDKDIMIVGGRYGLSSKNTTPAMIKAVYDMLKEKPVNNFTIGIDDDVTNLSLKYDPLYKTSCAHECLIYGYGSDGMVSASKAIIKLIGDNTDNYVQGYYQYDSFKSGGVTISHLRVNDQVINSSYYAENPSLVACTKEEYLDKFSILDNIANDGVFLLNTNKSEEEVNGFLNNNVKRIIKDRNIKVYVVDAYKLAKELGLRNKISTIMESIIIKLTNIYNYELALNKMKEIAYKMYSNKGEEVVNANYKAIEEAYNYVKEITINDSYNKEINFDESSIYSKIMHREGNKLKVSEVMSINDGTFPVNTSSYDKRKTVKEVPTWISEKCIMCNQCSLNCPHAVIRPFLIDEEEYSKLDDKIKQKCLRPILNDLKQYYYYLGISIDDCTGCEVCVNSCPKGALVMAKRDEEEQEIFTYLSNHIKDKKINKNTVIGSQFTESKFKYSGACAGCGETAYIKLLTQLYGDEMIISNATGCSSIYGASIPSIPYNLPWASSLFEDNAEYGYGMLVANNVIRNRIKDIMLNNMNNKNAELFQKWLDNMDNYEITKEVYNAIDYNEIPTLKELKEYIPYKMVWTIGGDGWAYDIGFGGIDHVLASNDDVNILVLDSEVYSNTGGQSSKATPIGAMAAFNNNGKTTNKKDLAKIAMSYPNVYVAQVSLGANPNQLIKAFNEATSHKGPSIIIAYAPCIEHGIKGGMKNSIDKEKMAVSSGYFPIFRYNPVNEEFNLDAKNVDFNLLEDFFNSETRYSMLKAVNPAAGDILLNNNKEYAIKRYEYYRKLEAKS